MNAYERYMNKSLFCCYRFLMLRIFWCKRKYSG